MNVSGSRSSSYPGWQTCRAVAPRATQAQDHVALTSQREALRRERGSGDIAAEPLEALRTDPGDADAALRVACERALGLLDGGAAGALEESIRPLTGDTIARERSFAPEC